MIPFSLLTVHALGLSILASFVPYKIYPAVFIATAVLFLLLGFKRKSGWLIAPTVFFIFSFAVFILVNEADGDNTTAIVKLAVNFFLLSSVCASGLKGLEGMETQSLSLLEKYVRIAILLLFAQVAFFQLKAGGIQLSSDDSYQAGLIFVERNLFWGVADKNILGAKIAIYGFLHSVLYYKVNGRVGVFFPALIIFSALLSLSRTSSLIYGLFGVVFFFYSLKLQPRTKVTVLFLFGVLAGLFILPKLADFFRLSNITNLDYSDGMGLRLIYWIALFTNLDHVSWHGNGILSGGDFLQKYAAFYNGEPNLHNIFLNTFLDLGFLGLCFYASIWLCYYKRLKMFGLKSLVVAFLIAPLFMLVNSLYTAYDSDPWIYMAVLFLVISLDSRRALFPQINLSK